MEKKGVIEEGITPSEDIARLDGSCGKTAEVVDLEDGVVKRLSEVVENGPLSSCGCGAGKCGR